MPVVRLPRWSPPGVSCGTHDTHSIQGTDDWRPLTEEEAARVPSALRWVRVAVKKEETVSDTPQNPNDKPTLSPWQESCRRVHQHRLDTIPGYKEDLERRRPSSTSASGACQSTR